ncbi:MAG: hypothetical protein ABW321_11930 [Polyangiales bacterium]
MWVWVVSCLAGLWALCWTPAAQACKCAGEPSIADAKAAAAAIFEGRVALITHVGAHDSVVELDVVRAWKDADVERIRVRTHNESAACGFPFERDQVYLVYAQASEAEANLPELAVSHCSRTRLVTEAKVDIAELGMGVVPVSTSVRDTADDGATRAQPGASHAATAPHDKPAAGGCAGCHVGSSPATRDWAGLALALGAAAYFRKRARRRG